MTYLIEEKEVELNNKKFVISKFKAFIGLEIMTQVPQHAVPYIGNYRELERLQIETLKHAAVITDDGKRIAFQTKEQIEAHLSPADAAFLQKELWEYNTENFPIADVCGVLVREVKDRLEQNMPTLTRLLQRLLKSD